MSKQKKSDPKVSIEDGVLVCPSCGGDYLHHDCVRSWFRSGEDCPTGIYTKAHPDGVEHSLDANTGNPSGRRDALSIAMWCEMCDCDAVLNICQHKGQTEIFWSVLGKRQWLEQDGDE